MHHGALSLEHADQASASSHHCTPPSPILRSKNQQSGQGFLFLLFLLFLPFLRSEILWFCLLPLLSNNDWCAAYCQNMGFMGFLHFSSWILPCVYVIMAPEPSILSSLSTRMLQVILLSKDFSFITFGVSSLVPTVVQRLPSCDLFVSSLF